MTDKTECFGDLDSGEETDPSPRRGKLFLGEQFRIHTSQPAQAAHHVFGHAERLVALRVVNGEPQLRMRKDDSWIRCLPVGQVGVGFDAEEFGYCHIQIQVRRQQHDVAYFESAVEQQPAYVGLELELAQRRNQHIGAMAVGKEVHLLDSRRIGDDAKGLLEVKHGELARLAIDVVAEEQAARAARRPREDRADELATEKMAQLAHRERRVLERVGVAMDEQHDFLARRGGEPPLDLSVQGGYRLLMRVNDGGGPHEALGGSLEAVGYRRKSPKLCRRSEPQVKRHRALAQGALGNQRVPGDPFAEVDRDRAEGHRMRALGAVG